MKSVNYDYLIKDYLLDINSKQHTASTILRTIVYLIVVALVYFEQYNLLSACAVLSLVSNVGFYFLVRKLKRKYNLQ